MILPAHTTDETDDALATTLLQHASRLTRLVFRQAKTEVSRSEASVLARLDEGPRRITALADSEGLAQPTMTLLVKRLEERGWICRQREATDGRVVIVSLTNDGRRAISEVREQLRPPLRAVLHELPDEHVAALQEATTAMARLIDELQRRAVE